MGMANYCERVRFAGMNGMIFATRVLALCFGVILVCAVQAEEPVDRLAGLATGEALVVDGFPMGAEPLGSVRFERIDLYAPGAAVRVLMDGESRVLDRSHRVFLSGRGDGEMPGG